MDIKGQTENNILIRGDSNTGLPSMDRPSRQKISKATVVLNYTIDWLNLIDTIGHSIKKQNTYSFQVHKECNPE